MNPANAWLLLTARSCGVDLSPSGYGSLKPADVAAALSGLDRPRFLLGMATLAGDREHLHELVTLVKLKIILPMAEYGDWKIKPGSQAYRRMSALAVFELLNNGRCIVCNGKGVFDSPQERPKTPHDYAQLEEERRQLRQALNRLRRLQLRALVLTKQIKAQHEKRSSSKDLNKRLKRVLRWIDGYVRMTDIRGIRRECETCQGSGTLRLDDLHRAWLTGFSREHWGRKWSSRYSPISYELAGWQSDCLSHLKRRLTSRHSENYIPPHHAVTVSCGG